MNRLTRHLDEVNESYFEHMANAMSFAGHMLIGAIACATHAIAPNLFESTGSNRIKFLHDRMVVMRKNPDHSASSSRIDVSNNPLDSVVSQGTE